MPLAKLSCATRPADVRRAFSQSVQDISRAIEPFGYYQATIDRELSFEAATCWQATFMIDPGPGVLVNTVRVNIEGGNHPQFAKTTEALPLKQGRIFEHQQYESLRDQLRSTAMDQGYLDATYAVNRVTIDPDALTADIELRLVTGERYRIGKIEQGFSFLHPELARRLITISKGDPADRDQIRRTQQSLSQTGYFKQVELVTIANADDATLDLTVMGEQNVQRDRSIGAGISTDKGVFATAGYARPLLNAYGHQLKAEMEAGAQAELFDLQAEYRIPGERPLEDWRSFYVGANAQNGNDAIDARTYAAGLRDSLSRDRWRIEPFLELTYERTDLDDADQINRALVPGIGLVYRNASEGNRPVGMRTRVELAGSTDKVYSDASFIRISGDIKVITGLDTRTRLILRSSAGYLHTSKFDEVPTNWRFFAGGDRSVRGFDYRSLGPRNANNDTTGGEWLFTASAEIDYLVAENWLASAFIDAGDVGFDGEKTEEWPVAAGVGIGWLSPVGAVRVAIGFPVQGSDEDFRVHISLGPDL